MNPEIQQELLKRLDAFAQKLGVTAEHLWGVLVKQAQIEATIAFGWTIFELILFVIAVLCLRAAYKHGREWLDGEKYIPLWATALYGCFATPLSIIAAMFNLFDFIRWYSNPEYFALQEILKVLR